jgi:hypothetical protein
MSHKAETSDDSVLVGFSKWILGEVAERQDKNGNKPKRGERRSRKGERMWIRAKHICYQGQDIHRGSDYPWRASLAVLALQRDGNTQWAACVTVAGYAGYPAVAARLGKSKHVKGRRPMDSVRKAETIRRTVNSQMKRLGAQLHRDLDTWLGTYREKYDRDSWCAEQIRVLEMRAGLGDTASTVELARLLHEQKDWDRAREVYSRARKVWKAGSVPERMRANIVEWFDRQIENCKLRRPLDPKPTFRLSGSEGVTLVIRGRARE